MVALPAASVVAGLMLLATAIRTGGADEVHDDVSRTAQIQQSDIGPDARAASMNLSAVVSLNDGIVALLPATGEFARDQPLLLQMSHPVDASQDRRLELQPDTLGWRAAADLAANHDWILELAPNDHSWRIHGRLKAGERAARLGPALSGN